MAETRGLWNLWKSYTANKEHIILRETVVNDIENVLKAIEKIYDPLSLYQQIESFYRHIRDHDNPHNLQGLWDQFALLEKAYRLWINYGNSGTIQDFIKILFIYINEGTYADITLDNPQKEIHVVNLKDTYKYLEETHNSVLDAHLTLQEYLEVNVNEKTPVFTYSSVSNSSVLNSQFLETIISYNPTVKETYYYLDEQAYNFIFNQPIENNNWMLKFKTTQQFAKKIFALKDSREDLEFNYLVISYNNNNTINLQVYDDTTLIKSSASIPNRQGLFYLIATDNQIYLYDSIDKQMISVDIILTKDSFIPDRFMLSKDMIDKEELAFASIYSWIPEPAA
jgi:hypothetical protein